MKFLKISLMALTLSAQMAHAGNGVKGGDDISAEFRNTVAALPQVLETQGLSKFPEINFSKFQEATADSAYKVELQYNLSVNRSPKAALSYPQFKLTQVDPNIWSTYSLLPDGEDRKNVLAFHETLVIMGLEDNDEYGISSRLYSNNFFGDKAVKSVGHFTQRNIDDESILTAVNYADNTSTFYFCRSKREVPSSCSTLGRTNHYYQQQDFINLHILLLKKQERYMYFVHYGTLLGAVGGAIGGAIANQKGPAWAEKSLKGYIIGYAAVGAVASGITYAFKSNNLNDYLNLTNPYLIKGQDFDLGFDASQFQAILSWIN